MGAEARLTTLQGLKREVEYPRGVVNVVRLTPIYTPLWERYIPTPP